jgi:sulfur carrier protein ThiS
MGNGRPVWGQSGDQHSAHSGLEAKHSPPNKPGLKRTGFAKPDVSFPGIRALFFSHHRILSMKILFINNDGGGFADHIDVAEGTTVRQLFQQQTHGGKAESYLIRVNRQPVPSDQVLQEGDRVSLTPTKIEGALAAER